MTNYRYDIRKLKHDAHGQWVQILGQIGIIASNKKHTPCPICGKDGTFRVYEKSENLTYTCSCGYGDGFKLLAEAGVMSLSDSLEFVNSYLYGEAIKPVSRARPASPQKPDKDYSEYKKKIKATLKNTYHSVTKKSQQHYTSRGLSDIPRIESITYGARWYKDVPFKDNKGRAPYHNVIVGKLSEWGENEKGIITIFTDIDYIRELSGDSDLYDKPMIKHVPSLVGCGVWIGCYSNVLNVSEGLENTLTICKVLNTFNAVSSVTSALMGGLIIPDGVDTMVVWADSGEAGTRSAELLASRYPKINTKIIYPADTGLKTNEKTDWNDLLKEHGKQVLRINVKHLIAM